MWLLIGIVIGVILGAYAWDKYGARTVAEEQALKASAAKAEDKVRNIFESR